jgi:hypothetical protein
MIVEFHPCYPQEENECTVTFLGRGIEVDVRLANDRIYVTTRVHEVERTRSWPLPTTTNRGAS